MSGTDRSPPRTSFSDRCALSLALRQSGVHIDEIVEVCAWPSRQAAYTAISRAKKPYKYMRKRPSGGPGPRYAFGGSIVGGKAFAWGDWDDQLRAWVAEDLSRPTMARRLSEMTGRSFTTNQVIGRIYRIRQRELAKKRSEG